jgi:hypothetical protein
MSDAEPYKNVLDLICSRLAANRFCIHKKAAI